MLQPPLPDDERFLPLGEERFQFACHPGVPCFNACCRQLNLMLTPYDVVRLSRRLGMTTGEFLDSHTVVEHGQNGWPMPRLKMAENDEQTCPFVTEAGCSVYPDRPGACRTYPLGRATRCTECGATAQEGYFLVKEEHCRGFEEDKEWDPAAWTDDQGLREYNAMNDAFMPIITRQAPDADPGVIAKKMQMFFMAAYNPDSFRAFVERSRLTNLYQVAPERVEAIMEDDAELLRFAFDWLRHSIFGETTLQIRPEVAAARMAQAQSGPRQY